MAKTKSKTHRASAKVKGRVTQVVDAAAEAAEHAAQAVRAGVRSIRAARGRSRRRT